MRPQQVHVVGLTVVIVVTCSGGRSTRLWGLCPGCAPRCRPVAGFDGRVPGGSEDGGLCEFVELWPSCASKAATRARSLAFSSLRAAILASRSPTISIRRVTCASNRATRSSVVGSRPLTSH